MRAAMPRPFFAHSFLNTEHHITWSIRRGRSAFSNPNHAEASAKADGRGSRIRTGDLEYPKLPRYQAALCPVRRGPFKAACPALQGSPVIGRETWHARPDRPA